MTPDELDSAVMKVWSGENATRLRKAQEACDAVKAPSQAEITAALTPLRDKKREITKDALAAEDAAEMQSALAAAEKIDAEMLKITDGHKSERRRIMRAAVEANEAAIANVVIPELDGLDLAGVEALNAALGARVHAISKARKVLAKVLDDHKEAAEIAQLEGELANRKKKQAARRQVIGAPMIESSESVGAARAKKG